MKIQPALGLVLLTVCCCGSAEPPQAAEFQPATLEKRDAFLAKAPFHEEQRESTRKLWLEVPDYLRKAHEWQILRHDKNALLKNTHERAFRIDDGGWLFCAVRWRYGVYVTLEPELFAKVPTPIEWEEQGWVPVGRIRDRSDSLPVYRRAVKAGETVKIATSPQISVMLLSVSDDNLAQAAELPRIVLPSPGHQMEKILQQPGLSAGERQEGLVPLGVLDSFHGTYQQGQDNGSLLHRELARQALLIAARDGLGLATRDATLREVRVKRDPDADIPLAVVASDDANRLAQLTVFRRTEGAVEVLWSGQYRLDPQNSLRDWLTATEELSRTKFVDALRRAEFQGTAAETPSDDAPGEAIQDLIPQLDPFKQYAALRLLHQEMRAQGESPARLAALARVYAQLGSLTEVHWSPARKAYQARALLYAQRLVTKTENSPSSLRQRAFVWALIGQHQAALDDLEQADALSQDDVPTWAEIIRQYCLYDLEALEKAAEAGEELELTRYLQLLATEGSISDTEIVRAASAFLQVQPGSFRALDAMCSVRELGTTRQATTYGLVRLATGLQESLSATPDLPKSVRTSLSKVDAKTPLDEAVTIQAEVIESLREAGAKETAAEPSLLVLGQLLRETAFLQSYRRLYLERVMLGVPTNPTLDLVRPLSKGHPYASYLETFSGSNVTAALAIGKILVELDHSEMTDNEIPLVNDLRDNKRLTDQQLQEFREVRMRHHDSTYRDLSRHAEEQVGYTGGGLEAAISRLNAVSPHFPLSVALRLRHDWEFSQDAADEIEERYWNSPTVLRELGAQYDHLGKTDDYIRCLEREVEQSPEYGPYVLLAAQYQAKGDEENTKATFDEFLERGISFGLEKARVSAMMARSYMDRGQWATARPYADRAAESWSQWGLIMGYQVHDQLGNYEEANVYLSRIAERYNAMGVVWYNHCRQRGVGDVQAAEQSARQQMRQAQNTEDNMIFAAYFHTVADEPRLAQKKFELLYRHDKKAVTRLQIAFAADETDDTATRDDILSKLAIQGPPGARESKSVLYGRAAELFRVALAENKPLDQIAMQKIIDQFDKVEAASLQYFTGKFLLLHEDEKDALPFLKAAAECPNTEFLNGIVARALLRDRDVEFTPYTAPAQKDEAQPEP